MKKTYTILALILVIALVPLLSSCNKNASEGTKGVVTTEKTQNEVYETEKLSVEVPQGWKINEQKDKPESIYIYKGDKGAYESPAMLILYYDPDTEVISPRDMLSEAKDIDPVKIGDYTWEGFTGKSGDYPITILSLKEPHKLQIQFFNEVGDQKINLEDADVQAIIRSISIK